VGDERTETRECAGGEVAAGLSADFLSTGDLARACETTVRTVRFYEETGLIEPLSRSDGGHRHFDEAQREKLQLIMDLREAGLSIQDIKDLFALKGSCATPDEASVRMAKTLEGRIVEMQRKIAVLRRLREELASMVTVIRECESCDTKAAFPKSCGDCDVMARPDLPRAMRLLWSK
jgi:DNA-binding transcriptional MerR regulator